MRLVMITVIVVVHFTLNKVLRILIVFLYEQILDLQHKVDT